ncbi:MAG: GDP-L-fucose synthase [Candidatus Peregrinibacteria bacterium]
MHEIRVLLTGGHGFLGENVQKTLRSHGFKGIITPSHQDFDLRDGEAVRAMFLKTKPTIVIHLAASVGGIRANQEHPGDFFYDNLMMGMQTMHEAYKAGVEKFVAIGTICAYPKMTPVPFREKDLWNGYPEETNAPYGLAKKMLLVQAQAYRQQYGFNAIYLLPVNLYGPEDNFDPVSAHVIPAMIYKMTEAKEHKEEEVILWGDGSPSREFLYVSDAAEAIVLATEKYDGPEPVNIGTGKEITIHDLASLIAEKVGFTGKITWDPSKPNGQPRRCLDVSQAKRLFAFTAQTELSEGLDHTIAWYREASKWVGNKGICE